MMQGMVTHSQRAEQFGEDRIARHVGRVEELIDVAPRLAVSAVAMRGERTQMVQRQNEDGQSVEMRNPRPVVPAH